MRTLTLVIGGLALFLSGCSWGRHPYCIPRCTIRRRSPAAFHRNPNNWTMPTINRAVTWNVLPLRVSPLSL